MAEVLCPMCGKPNPEHLEVCQFCQARLVPLQAGSGQDDDDWLSGLTGGQESNLPDWLNSGEDPQGEGQSDADWLDSMRSGGGMDDQSEEEALWDDAAPESAPEDWAERTAIGADLLARITDDEAPAAADESADDTPDWLSELGGIETEAPSGPPTEEGDLPDWLTELDSAGPDDQPEDAPMAAPGLPDEDEVPAWLSELRSPAGGDRAAQAASAAAPAGEDLPDWLSELNAAGDEEPEPAARAESTGRDDDMPDWPSELAGAEGEDAGDRPDWLSEFDSQAGEGDSEEPPAPDVRPTAEEEDLWFGGFMEEPPGEPEPAQLAVDPEEEVWLAGFVEDETPAPDAAPEVPEASLDLVENEAGLPDWLTENPAEAAVSETGGDHDETLPPWLNEFDPENAVPAEPAEEIPTWLASALDTLDVDEEGPETGAEDRSGDSPSETEDAAEPMPDWLAGYTPSISAAPAEEDLAEEMPDWLMDVGMPEAAAESEEAEVPEWLQELHARSPELNVGRREAEAAGWDDKDEKAAEETDAIDWMPGQAESTALSRILGDEEEIEEDLAPGELPEWLKSMRLIDATAPGTMEAGEVDAGSVVRVGPLAGLRGVLSAEPTAAQPGSAAPTHTARLNVSDAQQTRADQLQKMVAAETEPQPARRDTILSEQRVLRYIIAGLLFLAAVLPAIMPGRLTDLPAKPPEMDALGNMIAGLSESSAALVVFDYQPGMSGELDGAASAILDHVMLQQARLALVSTSPTGPALAERFIRNVEGKHNYAYGTQYVNLGYIPGEAAGLQFFKSAPQAAVPIAYDARPIWSVLDRNGTDPWVQPALAGVQTLGDFQMTILISDDPDNVRRWIEQVGPALPSGSLAVVASAQIEPLVRPYFDAANGQVAALVPGLYGGAAYEGFLQRQGPGRAAWDTVNIGILVAITLILGAGTYNLLVAWREQEAARLGRR